MLGPAMATPLAMLVTVAYYLMRLRGVVTLRLGQLFPWRLVTVNLTISFACAAPLLALLGLQVSPFMRLVVASALFLPLYVAALRLVSEPEPCGRARRTAS